MAADEKKTTHKREGKKQFKVWLDENEHARLIQIAKQRGMTAADWLRHRCIDTTPKRSRKGIDVVTLHRLQAQINMMGNNLNQLAARANTGERFPEIERLEAMLAELQKMTKMNAVALGYDTEG